MNKLLFLLLSLFPATALASTSYGDYQGAEYVRNYDGDTITFNLPYFHPIIGNNISIRVAGINTPEIRGKCKAEKELADTAKEMVKVLLADANNIELLNMSSELLNMSRGKYFRIIADIVADGKSVKEALIENNLAVAYDGGTKTKDWCQ